MQGKRCPRCGDRIDPGGDACAGCGYPMDGRESTGGQPERRREKRIKIHSRLKLNDQVALLIDISTTGMRLSCPKIPASPEVTILFETDEQRFHLKGRIVWRSRISSFSGTWEFGVYFEDPPDTFIEYVTRLAGAS